ncbi:hypothetical protein HK096_000942 [Nowakowskiella sp. JEL0078]|nr:hypothetical protein HK096_000942 [Nowakowskiella sp. JEL0078]
MQMTERRADGRRRESSNSLKKPWSFLECAQILSVLAMDHYTILMKKGKKMPCKEFLEARKIKRVIELIKQMKEKVF